MVGMEQYEYRHNLTVGHAAGTVAMTLSRHLNGMFFSTPEQKICRIRREYRKFLLNLQSSWEWVFVCNSLIITYKVTKNIPFPQLF